MHDPTKVRVCARWLQGRCTADPCLLQHQVVPDLMPVCSFFLQVGSCSRRGCCCSCRWPRAAACCGQGPSPLRHAVAALPAQPRFHAPPPLACAVQGCCSNVDCPYLHVRAAPGTAPCAAFRQGYCPLGARCPQQHAYAPRAATATGKRKVGRAGPAAHCGGEREGQEGDRRCCRLSAGCSACGTFEVGESDRSPLPQVLTPPPLPRPQAGCDPGPTPHPAPPGLQVGLDQDPGLGLDRLGSLVPSFLRAGLPGAAAAAAVGAGPPPAAPGGGTGGSSAVTASQQLAAVQGGEGGGEGSHEPAVRGAGGALGAADAAAGSLSDGEGEQVPPFDSEPSSSEQLLDASDMTGEWGEDENVSVNSGSPGQSASDSDTEAGAGSTGDSDSDSDSAGGSTTGQSDSDAELGGPAGPASESDG